MEKVCSTCKFLDDYFGDCCHPKGGGCKDVRKSMEGCLNQNMKWWRPDRKTLEEEEKRKTRKNKYQMIEKD